MYLKKHFMTNAFKIFNNFYSNNLVLYLSAPYKFGTCAHAQIRQSQRNACDSCCCFDIYSDSTNPVS